MWYYWWQRWHSAPCPEGFSPGTPVSLTLEKQLFSNSNLTKLETILQNWQQFNKIGDNVTKLTTIQQNWQEFNKIDDNLTKLAAI